MHWMFTGQAAKATKKCASALRTIYSRNNDDTKIEMMSRVNNTRDVDERRDEGCASGGRGNLRTHPNYHLILSRIIVGPVDRFEYVKIVVGRDQSLGLEILGDAKNIKVFMNYVHSTKRFEESHGDLHHAGQEDE
jgi:hypothetical protein